MFVDFAAVVVVLTLTSRIIIFVCLISAATFSPVFRFSFYLIPQNCHLSSVFLLYLFERKKTRLKGLLSNLRLMSTLSLPSFVSI